MSSLNFRNLFERDNAIVLLDGGLGTTLEDFQDIRTTDTVMWSAESLVGGNDEALVEAHLLFLRAGAKIISTATYQCSYSTFQTMGIDTGRAQENMRRAVTLAVKAKDSYERGSLHSHPEIRIALSLGPFGATLCPTQEFNGFYPPPYGPKAYTNEDINTNSFVCERDEQLAIKALAAFHFERLLVFASDDVWEKVDCIAMETVPLVREVIAIREAFLRLHEYLSANGKPEKPWWLSFIFPDAVPVQQNTRIFDYVQNAILRIPSIVDGVSTLPVPSGLGINCVDMDRIGAAVLDMQRALRHCCKTPEFATPSPPSNPNTVPWLVLYPNGSHFDVTTRKWRDQSHELWAKQLASLVLSLRHNSETPWVFPGFIIGGCCKAGPEKISQLARLLDEQGVL